MDHTRSIGRIEAGATRTITAETSGTGETRNTEDQDGCRDRGSVDGGKDVERRSQVKKGSLDDILAVKLRLGGATERMASSAGRDGVNVPSDFQLKVAGEGQGEGSPRGGRGTHDTQGMLQVGDTVETLAGADGGRDTSMVGIVSRVQEDGRLDIELRNGRTVLNLQAIGVRLVRKRTNTAPPEVPALSAKGSVDLEVGDRVEAR